MTSASLLLKNRTVKRTKDFMFNFHHVQEKDGKIKYIMHSGLVLLSRKSLSETGWILLFHTSISIKKCVPKKKYSNAT